MLEKKWDDELKLSYFVVGTNDMAVSERFYNELFDQTSLKALASTERMVFWQGDDFAFAIASPFDGAPASNGNGTMFGFDVGSASEVDRLHKKGDRAGWLVRRSPWKARAAILCLCEGPG